MSNASVASANHEMSKNFFRKFLNTHYWLKWFKQLIVLLLIVFLLFLIIDRLMPLPIDDFKQRSFAQLVVAADGQPLRAFPDKNGIWRYPVELKDVSPLYLDALLNYEDRYFYQHIGINPLSLIRALGQAIKHRRVISGASTLTMQVARILEPHEKTIAGKSRQMFRALQLEWHYSKDEILTYYLNYAPFGGPIEGVEAASFTYLGKSAKNLTHSEAALLAVLPQSPSRFRPDKYPLRAKQARNKLLQRLAKFEVWTPALIEELKAEEVWAEFNSKPILAPLLSRQLISQYSQKNLIKTEIDRGLQSQLEPLIKDYIDTKQKNLSASVVVMDNQTSMAKAYIGSADFANPQRSGFVDMNRAIRSPGSTLKPFIYGLAIDQGLIHSESLLFDVPQSFNGYRPKNFSDNFSSPVSVSQALGRSLNMPAVQVLNELSPEVFIAELANAGFNLQLPNAAKPNLSLALGGGGANLQQLVGLFSALGRKGKATQLKLTDDEPQKDLPLLSEGSSWIVQNILSGVALNNQLDNRLFAPKQTIAYKTGTSYGARDAWVLAVSEELTIGVWVGSPDGSFSVDNTGRTSAVPLLERVLSLLDGEELAAIKKPANVDLATICWPLGTSRQLQSKAACHQKRSAYLLDGTAPATLNDSLNSGWFNGTVSLQIDNNTGLRVTADCLNSSGKSMISHQQAVLWPKVLEPWLAKPLRSESLLPKFHPDCPNKLNHNKITIAGIDPSATIYPEPNQRVIPEIQLQSQGSVGETYWFLNGVMLKDKDVTDNNIAIKNLKPGSYRLTVIDQAANFAELDFQLES